jgi:hypothetical protein
LSKERSIINFASKQVAGLTPSVKLKGMNSEVDPNLSPPMKTGFIRRVRETSFYRKALAYRPAYLRGALGIAIAVLVWDKDHPGDWRGTMLQGLVAWRLFIDSSIVEAREEAKKIL